MGAYDRFCFTVRPSSGFKRTGNSTAIEEELVNLAGCPIYIPRAASLSAYDRVIVSAEMSRFFSWSISKGVH